MLGCSNKDEPFIEELDDNMNKPLTILDYQVTGKRDGAISEGTFNFMLDNGEEIQLYLQVSYNPKPVLRSGFWNLRGNQPRSGKVRPKSLKFLGGQGESPSIGGRFELLEDANPRFLVFIPLRPIKESNW